MKLYVQTPAIITLLLAGSMLRAQVQPDNKKPDEKKPPANAFYPLQPGMSWTYRSPEGFFTIRAAGQEKVGDHDKCIRLETVRKLDEGAGAKDEIIANEHVKVLEDGVYRCAYQGEPSDPMLKFLPADPANPKETKWKFKSKIAELVVDGEFEIVKDKKGATVQPHKIGAVSYPETVTVVAKDVEVELVKGTKSKVTMTYVYAKDIGLIEQQVKLGNGNPIKIELAAFKK